MKILFKNLFYNLIEFTNTFEKYGIKFKADLDDNKQKELLKIINDTEENNWQYFHASMLLLEAKNLSDETFLHLLPKLTKAIIEENGLLQALINRLNTLQNNIYTKPNSHVLKEFIDYLEKANEKNITEQMEMLSLL